MYVLKNIARIFPAAFLVREWGGNQLKRKINEISVNKRTDKEDMTYSYNRI